MIEELAGTERRPADAIVRDARDKLVSEVCPPSDDAVVTDNKDPRYAGHSSSPLPGSNRRPLLTMEVLRSRWNASGCLSKGCCRRGWRRTGLFEKCHDLFAYSDNVSCPRFCPRIDESNLTLLASEWLR